jgi:hypothetical protein
MVNQRTAIYRSEALRRYMTRHEKSVFPKLIAPRTFLYLWLIVGLLFIGGLCALFADIPIYAPALAVVVEADKDQTQNAKEVRVVLLLSPEYLTKVEVNQRVFLRMNRGDALISSQISNIEPRVVSAGDARSRFALSGNAANRVNDATAVALIPAGVLPGARDAASYVGTSGEAQVEIGRRRLISFLPFVGRFFESGSRMST